jgi:uncharacterized protein
MGLLINQWILGVFSDLFGRVKVWGGNRNAAMFRWRSGAMDRRQFLTIAVLLPTGALAQSVDKAGALVAAARAQVGRTTLYDPAYVKLSYPGGDVPEERGVCTDVVIRAYRDAFGIDLQKLVHEDMRKNFAAYPTRWGLKKPDRNIDHRRVPNLQTFFARKGAAMEVSKVWPGYHAGDLVTMMLPGNLPHIGIVSYEVSEKNIPLLIHNIGGGTQEENVLQRYEITGRYRFGLE